MKRNNEQKNRGYTADVWTGIAGVIVGEVNVGAMYVVRM